MATAPSQGNSSVAHPPLHRVSIGHGNAAVVIRGRFSDPSAVGSASYDDVIVQMGFHVCMLHRSHSPPSNSSVCKEEWRCANEELFLSELHILRRAVPHHLLGRLVLDDDDNASLLAEIIETFVLRHTVGRVLPRSDTAAQDQTARRWVIFQVDVNVLMDERDPVIKKVTYQREHAAEEEAALLEIACPICLGDFCTGEEVDVTLCGHAFHPACLGRWLKQTPRCPLCRSRIPFSPDFAPAPPIYEHGLAWAANNN